MVGTLVLELSDGEELVLEGVPVGRRSLEDPRDRAIEVRRLAVNNLTLDEPRLAEGHQP